MSRSHHRERRYQVQVRTEEIARQLTTDGFATGNLTSALEQLKDWGAVTWRAGPTSRSASRFARRRPGACPLAAAGRSSRRRIPPLWPRRPTILETARRRWSAWTACRRPQRWAVALSERASTSPWDPGLATAMRTGGVAVYEEQVIDELIDDLACVAR